MPGADLALTWRPHLRRLARVSSETGLSKPQLMESRRLVRCLMAYIGQHHGEIQPLFELFSAFLVRGPQRCPVWHLLLHCLDAFSRVCSGGVMPQPRCKAC